MGEQQVKSWSADSEQRQQALSFSCLKPS
jgi:hypothetical protein